VSPSQAPLFPSDDRSLLDAAVRAGHENPFAAARGEGAPGHHVAARLDPVVERARTRLAAGAAASTTDLTLYKEGCLVLLHDRYAERLRSCIEKPPARVDFYGDFASDHARLFHLPGRAPDAPTPAHIFACGFQMQRALHYISSSFIGESPPAARLRADV
jgi:hypothetical protein